MGDTGLAQCCCGRRLLNPGERVITNDVLHERLGDDGAFCGSVMAHDLRDAIARALAAEASLAELREKVEALARSYDRSHWRPASYLIAAAIRALLAPSSEPKRPA